MRGSTLAILLSFLALAGCGHSPAPNLYVLSGTEGGGTLEPEPVTAILRVQLPEYLDRPQIVSRQGANALALNEDDRWGEPLDKGVQRALCETLSRHLPGARVVSPQEARGQPVRYEYGVVLDAYEPDGAGNVVMRGRWRLSDARSGRVLADGALDERQPLAAPGAPAVVEAMSRSLDEAGRQIAEATAATVGDGFH